MKRIAFSPASIADLNGIWDYSANHWGPDRADLYINEIRDACNGIASGQRYGRHVDARSGYLRISAGSHVVYYQARGDVMNVIRVLHSRMDVDRHL
jgi:toxin ParE1/3/4